MTRFRMAALLISPDRKIAEQLWRSAMEAGTFEIVTGLEHYPAPETLETRMRQARAEVLLIDVATDLETAAALIRQAGLLNPQPPVIALHTANDSAAILRALRCGAAEFFHAPFEASVQEAAIARLGRIFESCSTADRERGRLVAFTGAKAGSGASTLAAQAAFALKRAAPLRKILLADLNLLGGSIAFQLRLEHDLSVLDLVQPGVRVTHQLWSEVVVDKDGVDILLPPDLPVDAAPDDARLQAVLDWARASYDIIVTDLPVVFQRTSLVCMTGADHVFLVCTPQLASLNLARRAVKLLQQLEFESSRIQVLINRMDAKSDLSSSDLSKIFDCRVDRGLPGDPAGVMDSLRKGAPLEPSSALGRAIGELAAKLMGTSSNKPAAPLFSSRRTASAPV